MKKYVLDANALLDLVEAGPGFQPGVSKSGAFIPNGHSAA
jgi:hypothetical protein